MGCTLKGRLNQSVPETHEVNLWGLYNIWLKANALSVDQCYGIRSDVSQADSVTVGASIIAFTIY